MRAFIDTLYQTALGIYGEIKRRDEFVYWISEGNLPNQGGRLQVDYLGRKRFAGDFLMFFDRDAVDAAIQQNVTERLMLPLALLRRRQALACPPQADVMIVDHFLEFSAPKDSLTLAPHINATMKVMPTLDEQLAMVRSKGHRRKLQAALKKGINWRKTHSLADFNLFYDVMYEPFVHDRFRYGASLVPREKMRQMFLTRGFLLLVEEDGVPVSGAFIYTSRRDPQVMYYWKYGLAHSTTLSPNVFGERNAAQEACVLRYACEEGFREVDWGLTRAVPTDGIFTHKKRMGCDFKVATGSPDFRIIVNPAAKKRLLSRFPLIVSEGSRLIGLIAYEGSVDGKAGVALSESLANVCFESLSETRLMVGQELAENPKLAEIIKQVSDESGKDIVVTTL